MQSRIYRRVRIPSLRSLFEYSDMKPINLHRILGISLGDLEYVFEKLWYSAENRVVMTGGVPAAVPCPVPPNNSEHLREMLSSLLCRLYMLDFGTHLGIFGPVDCAGKLEVGFTYMRRCFRGSHCVEGFIAYSKSPRA